MGPKRTIEVGGVRGGDGKATKSSDWAGIVPHVTTCSTNQRATRNSTYLRRNFKFGDRVQLNLNRGTTKCVLTSDAYAPETSPKSSREPKKISDYNMNFTKKIGMQAEHGFVHLTGEKHWEEKTLGHIRLRRVSHSEKASFNECTIDSMNLFKPVFNV